MWIPILKSIKNSLPKISKITLTHSLRLVAENLKKTPLHIYIIWLKKESTICVRVKPSRLSHEV
jgi:hypothetical protein